MPLIWQKLGVLDTMDSLRILFFDSLAMALFQNDYVPTVNSTLADFTEATFPGYVPQSISTPNPAFTNAGGAGEVDCAQVTFTQTGGAPQTVYGYFIYDIALVVIAAQRFPAPQIMTGAGASLDVGAIFQFRSEFAG